MRNAIGRWLLSELDFQICGLLALALGGVFVVWRKWRSGSVPPITDLFHVALGSLSILGSLLLVAIFLLTSPPAVSELSTDKLVLIGVVTPITVFYLGCKQLGAAFFPKPPPLLTINRRIAGVLLARSLTA